LNEEAQTADLPSPRNDRSTSGVSPDEGGGSVSDEILDELAEEAALSEDQDPANEDSPSESSDDASWLRPVPIPPPLFIFKTFSQEKEGA
jgi:hypothetical protein